ncbi:MAG: nucleotide exchange factor GrpE [Hyphomicrobiales bacterium]|nr:MAG: nucleotide exchange factor GrpE [Hyphomicrobiales bacterium]
MLSDDEVEEFLGDEVSEEELAEEEASEGFADPLEALAADCQKLETENTELKDRILLTAADMENLRRRTTKDVADARAFSIAGFARDMLAVSDNLRRTIDSVPEDDKGSEDMKNFLEGLEMTEREMLNTLEKHGVKKLVPLDEKFDPNFHQAMFELPNSDIPNNTIVQVVQDGYVIGNRVLRPAMVGVAKGGPKFVAPTSDANDAETDGAES